MNTSSDDPAARTNPGVSGRPGHALRPLPRRSRIAAGIGAAAGLTAVGLGTAALIGAPQPATGAQRTLQPITVTSPAAVALPPAPEILALVDRGPDFGPLADPHRRASCLTGLGYPASTRILGARPIEAPGATGVLLVLPGERHDEVVALAVAGNCSSADTGLLADTVVRRP